MTDVREVLSALIDRESVDADVLAEVLEDPANRAMLVDFVRLRAAILDDEVDETTWKPQHPVVRDRALTWGLRAAAALLFLSLGVAGGLWGRRMAFHDSPPEPSRVISVQLQ